jgi:hypothetical protein
MATIADFNYVMGILDVSVYQQDIHRSNFQCLQTDEERADFLKNLTSINDMKNSVNKASEGVNKGTAGTVKATKAAAELAAIEGININTVKPNAEGKVGVEEVKQAAAENK